MFSFRGLYAWITRQPKEESSSDEETEPRRTGNSDSGNDDRSSEEEEEERPGEGVHNGLLRGLFGILPLEEYEERLSNAPGTYKRGRDYFEINEEAVKILKLNEKRVLHYENYIAVITDRYIRRVAETNIRSIRGHDYSYSKILAAEFAVKRVLDLLRQVNLPKGGELDRLVDEYKETDAYKMYIESRKAPPSTFIPPTPVAKQPAVAAAEASEEEFEEEVEGRRMTEYEKERLKMQKQESERQFKIQKEQLKIQQVAADAQMKVAKSLEYTGDAILQATRATENSTLATQQATKTNLNQSETLKNQSETIKDQAKTIQALTPTSKKAAAARTRPSTEPRRIQFDDATTEDLSEDSTDDTTLATESTTTTANSAGGIRVKHKTNGKIGTRNSGWVTLDVPNDEGKLKERSNDDWVPM